MRHFLTLLTILILLLAACSTTSEPEPTPVEAEVSEPTAIPTDAPTDTPTELPVEESVESEPATDEPETPTVVPEPTELPEPTEVAVEVEEEVVEDAAADSAEAEEIAGSPLAIPPLLEYTVNDDGAKVFDLVMQNGTMEFVEGVESATMGFNGNYLGPTIRVDKGDDVVINVQNNLNADTSVHWHGLHVPPEMDGSPHQLIEPGQAWTATYPILNEASTMWYHPHPHGNSATQVLFGLAGLYLIDDDNSKNLDIPHMYGVDDIPLVIQDRKFEDGVMDTGTRGALYYGDNMFANGTLDAYLEVPAKQIRLRILNGSLSRFYSLGFADGREFHHIATDGGFTEAPTAMTELLLAGAERAEIIVDLSDGEEAVLMTFDNEALTGNNGGEYEILRLIPDTSHQMAESDPTPIPEVLNTIERWDESEAAVVRPIVLGGPELTEADPTDLYIVTEHADQGNAGSGGITINGKLMDMSRVDEVVTLGDIEIWEITNNGQSHPIHIHEVQFLILDRNGEPPEAHERGWKDTVLVGSTDTVRVMMKFEHYTNEEVPFMFHCHILQHEDGGMMGQFIVVDPEAEADAGIMKYLVAYSELQSFVPASFEFQFESDAFICPIPGTG